MNCPNLTDLWFEASKSGIFLVQRDLVAIGDAGPELVPVEHPTDRAAVHVDCGNKRYSLSPSQSVVYTCILQLVPPPATSLRRAQGDQVSLGQGEDGWYTAEVPVFPFKSLIGNGLKKCPVAVRGSLALPMSLEGSGQLWFVKDGVLLEAQSVDLGCPGALALSSAERLETDLSQLGIVQNAAYEELLADLRAHVAEMVAIAPEGLSLMLRSGVGEYGWKKQVLERLPR
jgi:hypothetical protein